jgi:hypothetical protein
VSFLAVDSRFPKRVGKIMLHAGSFAWPWLWAAIGMAVLILLPLALWRGHRMVYAAALCTVGIAALTFLWGRNRRMQERFSLTVPLVSAARGEDDTLLLLSGGGGISLAFECIRDTHPMGLGWNQARWRPAAGPYITWHWLEMKKVYPNWNNPYFEKWGFGIAGRDRPSNEPGFSSKSWGLYFPNWMPILLLSLLPTWWFFRRPARRREFRRRNRLCESCGYSLQGLAEPVRCPECGMFVTSQFDALATIAAKRQAT